MGDAEQNSLGVRPDLATGILIGSVCSSFAYGSSDKAHVTLLQHFENHPAICCGTAQDIQLQHQLISDGRWRVICKALKWFRRRPPPDFGFTVFPGDVRKQAVKERLQSVCEKLNGLIRRFTPVGMDIDSVIQVLSVFASPRLDVEKKSLPEILKPKKSPYGVPGKASKLCIVTLG